MTRRLWVLAWALALVLPWLVSFSLVGSINLAATYAMVAASIVLLTGWVGQISLGHSALVGIGAYLTGWTTEGLGIGFPFNLPVTALAGAIVAAMLGVVALRVRGLYLAVATLVFSWMASEFLFRQPWLTAHDQISEQVVGARGSFPSFDFTDRRVFASVAWAVVVLILQLLTNLRSSRSGRAFLAVRGSEFAAASMGIDVVRTKLIAFALSGAIAGVAGNVSLTQARVVTADQFTFAVSLFFLAIAVVGGLESLAGGVASAILFAGLTEVFFQVEILGGYLEIVSGALLALTLLLYPEGLAGLGARFRARIGRTAGRHAFGARPLVGEAGSAELPLRSALRARESHASPTGPVLVVRGVTVRFGGLTAVADASLEAHAGQITGLIGPNGAGKTTLFNAIAGFNRPVAGSVLLHGKDVTRLPVHRRAGAGMARTFQHVQVLGALTVFENLLVAAHATDPTRLWQHVLWTPGAAVHESIVHRRAWAAIERVGLEDVASSRCQDLPFGVLRRVELARALMTGFSFVMLDEPASGLDDSETRAFSELLTSLRDDGMSLLLIEHDVEMVMRVCDRITVLDQGRVIADGSPAEIRADGNVVAAYLGQPGTTDEEAVA